MTGNQGSRSEVTSPGRTEREPEEAQPERAGGGAGARAGKAPTVPQTVEAGDAAGVPKAGPGVSAVRTGTAARSLGRAFLLAVPAAWVAGVLLWELLLPVSTHCAALLAATPALACAGTGARTGVWLGAGCAVLALGLMGSVPVYEEIGSRVGIGAAIVCVAMASCYTVRRRARLTDELARTREVATAAQQALIRPLPARIEGFTVAAGYLSAARGAAVGGDLYDAVSTVHGVRVVIGDVRGHGLGAVSTVAALLGSFREAAHDEPRLERVPHRLERALERHLAARRYGGAGPGAGGRAAAERAEEQPADAEFAEVDEEFVTVLLLEARSDGSVSVVNCGHPWPYRLLPGPRGECRSELLSTDEPLPPLGMVPLPLAGPEVRHLRLSPGEALFFYTDGAEDARDAVGRCFPLLEALTAAQSGRGARAPRSAAPTAAPGEAGPAGAAAPAALVGHVRRALLRHAGGRLPDDVALLALRRDGCRVHGPRHGPPPERAGAGAPSACSCP